MKKFIIGMLAVMLIVVQVMEVTVYASGNQTVVMNEKELLQALENANDGDVILIGDTIYVDSNGMTFGSANKHVTIRRSVDYAFFLVSGYNNTFQNITFDGSGFEGMYSSYFVMNNNCTFKDVTFQNYHASCDGGAMTVQMGEVNLIDCIFKDNSAGSGSHIDVMSGTVNIAGCSFTGGVAERCGAIRIQGSEWDSATVKMTDSIATGNSAKYGGGICNQANLTIRNSVIFGNNATVGGADIVNTKTASFSMESLDELIPIYAKVKILPVGWVNDAVGAIPDTDATAPNSIMKMTYSTITEPPVSDGDKDDETESGGQGGTEEKPSEPDDKDESEGDDSTGSGDEGTTTTPDTDQGNDNNDSGGGETETPDDQDKGDVSGGQGETDNDAPVTDKEPIVNNNTTNTDNSVVDNSQVNNTDNSVVNTDNSVVTNNQESNTYNTYNTTTTTNTTTQAESKEQVQEVPQQADADLPDSFKIESNGANVTVELVDGVYVVKVHDTVTEPQAVEASTESVNMYEIIKIGLLAVLVLAVFMKRKE